MSVMMQIRNVPDELATELKARAAASRMSLSDFLLQQLIEIAKQPSLDQMLDRLTSRPRRDLGITAVELLDEARTE